MQGTLQDRTMRALVYGGGAVGLGLASCLLKSRARFDILARRDTAEHKSSTLQDIAAQKRTEIDALNGAVIKLAQKFKLAVPYNCTVYNLVKFIEAGKSNRGQHCSNQHSERRLFLFRNEGTGPAFPSGRHCRHWSCRTGLAGPSLRRNPLREYPRARRTHRFRARQ